MYAALHNRNPVQELGLVVDENLELVKRIAWRLHQRLPDCVQIEDLIQAGTIGLLEAWERYQPDEDASFSTFAGIRIRGAMLDEIRRGDWAPRSLHRAARAVKQARADVERRCGRAAPNNEVAAEMGMPLNEFRRLCDDVALSHVASLDSTLTDQPTLEVSAGDDSAPEAAVEYQDMCEAIQRASTVLPEREQLLLHLYYESGQNLRQIAEHLGVSESRVCQLHGRAIRQIRSLVGEAEAA
jgi:RNA polymerase sigma factor for flagellar operon FliA